MVSTDISVSFDVFRPNWTPQSRTGEIAAPIGRRPDIVAKPDRYQPIWRFVRTGGLCHDVAQLWGSDALRVGSPPIRDAGIA